MTETLSDDLQKALGHLKREQLSDQIIPLLKKLQERRDAEVTSRENALLLNPTETAAVLSVKYRRPIKSSYIKELTRPVRNEKTEHITPARLHPEKRSGKSLLYRTKNVLAVTLRETPDSSTNIPKDTKKRLKKP